MFTRPRYLASIAVLFLSLAGCDSDSNLISPGQSGSPVPESNGQLAAPVPYQYLPFDVPAEFGAYTTAYGNNDWGAIVGNFGAPDESVHGFLFDGQHFVDIVLPGSAGDHGSLGDINDFGVAVGSFTDAETEIGHAFLRTWKGVITVLPDPASDAVSTEASGINNFGTIVGTFFDDAGLAHGFIRRLGHSTVFDYPDAVRTRLNGINNRGEIAGQWSDTDRHQHGFVLAGRHTRPVEFPGAVNTRATGINDLGRVVGFYDDADGVTHGFVFAGGQYTSLDFPGASDTAAFGINNWGVITGTYDEFSRGMIVVPSHK